MSEAPRGENGILFVGPWREDLAEAVRTRWPGARFDPLREDLVRIDLTETPRGECPGFNDAELLGALSTAGAAAVGFYCDGESQSEGVRVFQQGRQRDRRRVSWPEPESPDPVAWPISSVALSLGVSVDAVTRVARPPRPPLMLRIEGLLNGEEPVPGEVTHRALELLGKLLLPEATAALVRALASPEWVIRYHAARGYTRVDRQPGREGRPRLEQLLEDEDEGVRESALRGILELLPEVTFSDRELQAQIDAAAARGRADEDEDVRAAAEEVAALRQRLLG